MKQFTLTTVLVLFFMNGAIAKSGPQAGTYKIDARHSNIALEVTHLTISTKAGSFTHIDGKIDLKENFQDSKVYMLVDSDGSFPDMTFNSTKIEGTKEKFDLTGNLTINGITQEVTFKSQYLGVINGGFGDDKAAFIAQTKIILDNEEVTIDLRLLANRPNKATASLYQEVQEIVQ